MKKNLFKRVIIGQSRDPHDPNIFHKVSLMAFFAWVGLGSDGLSSSCYGPAEVMHALHGHPYLGIFVAIAAVITIFVISSSYSQIIELFPGGGGGYIVSSKLLSPTIGMISGSALIIDYVLTITVSLASGADALFSFLPQGWQFYKLEFALLLVIGLTILNLRGVKESLAPLVPVFLTFVFTHAFIIVYGIISHLFFVEEVVSRTTNELNFTFSQLGMWGTFMLMMRAYSMGAGTFTGIEAVANGIPILKEPRVKTAKTTMKYMAYSLAITVFGLMLNYLLFEVKFQEGKTINASLLESVTYGWNPSIAYIFIIITLISEAALLFVAAQTGFLDGPRVMANMAKDRWVPSRFASLSDRLVTQNGIIMMGVAAFLLMLLTEGSVTFLVVLYSINVFLGFILSQTGMVKHWLQVRHQEKGWWRKLIINGIGLTLSAFILVFVVYIKFHEGGWITIVITTAVVIFFAYIKHEYNKAGKLIEKLNVITESMNQKDTKFIKPLPKAKFDPNGRTAVLLVNGFTGIGVHSLLSIFKLFGDTFKNYLFIQIGVIDAGTFSSVEKLQKLRAKSEEEVQKYVDFIEDYGYYAEGITATGLEIEEEIIKLIPSIKDKFAKAVFFGGQIVFPKDTFMSRLLHNYTVFSVQRKLYALGFEFVILPIKLRE